MTPERWQKIKAVYAEAESTPPGGRSAILDRLCHDDPDLRSEVEELLSGDDSGTFIHDAIGKQAATLSQSRTRQDGFGRYQLIRVIGRGGMGSVYEAVRVDDFHKKVALKIIRQEFDSDYARARFQQERQVLAALEHPYIARLLDGGESADGSPYLVLEFVDGVPIDQYCAKLDLPARLRLFIKVCEAVEQAHRNLVIHRDLKPANILVTADGTPKLLDFGIAKLLDPTATATQTGLAALTPEYGSPEQVRGLPISTASDIYSLGVILYQLLTGRKPYTLESLTAFEMDRVICQQPPAPPGLGDELDHILLMALRKEPERRYANVRQFAEDLERYLEQRPVLARPDTLRYRTAKFVRRNWVAALVATAFVTTIAVGAGIALQQAHIARQRFQQVRNLSHRFIFDFNDQIRQLPGSTGVREMMVTTALEYLDNLSSQARGDAGLEWELAKAYEKVADVQGSPVEASLGHTEAAIASYQKAIAMQEDLARRGLLDAAQRDSLVTGYLQMEAAYRALGRPAESVKAAEQGLRHARTVSESAQARALSHLALTQIAVGEPARAFETARAAQLIFAREAGGEQGWGVAHRGLVAVLSAMGDSNVRMARFEQATGYFQQGVVLRERRLAEPILDPSNARELVLVYHAIGDVLGAHDRFSLGRPVDALVWYRKALALAERLYASDPKNATARLEIARSAGKLGAALEAASPAEALRLYRRALAEVGTVVPPGGMRDAINAAAWLSMAACFGRLGSLDEARENAAKSRAIYEANLSRNPRSRSDLSDLADTWKVLGDIEGTHNPAVALESYRKALGYANRAAEAAPRDFSVAFRQVESAEALLSAEETAGADGRPEIRQLVDLWTKWDRLQPGSPYIQEHLRAALERAAR